MKLNCYFVNPKLNWFLKFTTILQEKFGESVIKLNFSFPEIVYTKFDRLNL